MMFSGSPSPRAYIDRLRARQTVVANLCAALEAYLNFDTTREIQAQEESAEQISSPEYQNGLQAVYGHYSDKDLVEAQAVVTEAEEAITATRASIEQLPEALRAFAQGGLLPMLQDRLRTETAKRDHIMAILESRKMIKAEKE